MHTVAPLEGLWWAENLSVFRARDKSAWDWTLMISQPDWVPAETVALAAAGHPVRFERYAEGRSMQVLHVGPYDDEGATLRHLH